MKISQLIFVTATVLLLNPQLSNCFAQGSLTPPGAPGPTMVTLSQIEPRTPISSAPFTITKPGSYYFTTNVTVSSGNAIQIEANNVWLDLNGFTISSTQNPVATSYGILASAVTNVTIVNGYISGGVTNSSNGVYGGSGFGYGVFCTNAVNVSARGVSVSGCQYYGIYFGFNSSVVEGCTVNEVGGFGIEAQSVSDSTAANCGSYGIVADAANNCYAQGYSIGISVNTANNCFGYGLTVDGISADIANNCYGYCSGSGDGVFAQYIAIGCVGLSSTGAGINAYIANSCYSNTGDGAINNKYNMP